MCCPAKLSVDQAAAGLCCHAWPRYRFFLLFSIKCFDVSDSSFLQPVNVPLNSITICQPIDCSPMFGIIHQFVEDVFCLTVHDINKDFEQYPSVPVPTLTIVTNKQPMAGLSTTDKNPVNLMAQPLFCLPKESAYPVPTSTSHLHLLYKRPSQRYSNT